MALDFTIISLEKNHKLNRYFAEIEFEGSVGKYEIITDAKIYYLDWISEQELRLSILNGFDMPFNCNGEMPYFEVGGLSSRAQEKQKRLKDAFIDFIKNEYGEFSEDLKNTDNIDESK